MKDPAPRRPVVILISGRGSNMHAVIEASLKPGAAYRVAAVISDRQDAAGLATARSYRIEAHAVPAPRGLERAAYDRMLAAAIDAHAPALVVLAGFMRILSAAFVQAYAGRLLNIHPSLLPKYPGLHTHRRALQANDAEHGATVHFVTEQLDGGPAVMQGRVSVQAGDTEETLAARVLQQEHQIYPLVIDWFCTDRLRLEDGKPWLDGRPLEHPVRYPRPEPEGSS